MAMDEQLKKIVDGAAKTDAEVERMNQLVAELSTTLAELRSAPQTFAAAVGGAGGSRTAMGWCGTGCRRRGARMAALSSLWAL